MLTVKINGSDLGLVHKGSMHFAKNTAPDVCKTPSPGGPVPIPYPVIVSMSSDLANGTTTVKADGEMAAIKGCEYSMCTGDEPGTVGGIVSNTFKKEAKFILFSFDVKLDGKNACRLGDKMTMNHQNTVCMSGTSPTSVRPKKYDIPIDCAMLKKNDPPPPPPNGCATLEVCAKIRKFNKAKGKKKLKPSPSNPDHPRNNEYKNGKNRFHSAFNRLARQRGKCPATKKMFMHECRFDKWDGKEIPDRSKLNPDHVKDAGVGGSLKESNLLWMDAEANQEMGRNMSGYSPSKHPGGLKAPSACGCN